MLMLNEWGVCGVFGGVGVGGGAETAHNSLLGVGVVGVISGVVGGGSSRVGGSTAGGLRSAAGGLRGAGTAHSSLLGVCSVVGDRDFGGGVEVGGGVRAWGIAGASFVSLDVGVVVVVVGVVIVGWLFVVRGSCCGADGGDVFAVVVDLGGDSAGGC